MTIKIFYKRRTNRYYIVVKHDRFSFSAVGDDIPDIIDYMYDRLILWDITGYEAALYRTVLRLDYGITV